MSKIDIIPSSPRSTSKYMVLQSLHEGLISGNLPSKLSRSWKRFIRTSGKKPHATATTIVVSPSSKTITGEMPVVTMNENLSAEDREAREKGLKLLERFEYLVKTDEGFRRWLQVGFDQAQAGDVFAFDESRREEEL